MDETALISVVVPVYNVASYLPKCIDSIINQTYSNLEIILVDDGSSDNSGFICDEYAKRDGRIIVIHKQNGGLSDARNAGIAACTGDYIAFVDSDDYIDHRMYEVLYNFAIQEKLDVAMCGSVDDVNGRLIYPQSFSPYVLSSKTEIINDLFVNKWGGACIAVWNKLFKREVVKNIKFEYGKTYEDVFYILHWINNTVRFGRLSNPFYYYVQRVGSITNQKIFKSSIVDVVDAYKRNLNIIIHKYPKSILAGKYRLYWSYKNALSRIIYCSDYYNGISCMKEIQAECRKQWLEIIRNPYLSKKDLLAFVLIIFDYRVYFLMKKIYCKYNNKIV